MDSNIKNKCILVTGATKGIGWAISKKLADLGAHVVGLARHTESIDFPGFLYECDLANAGETEDMLRMIREKYPIDGIVNNVGIVKPEALGEVELASLYEVFDLNVRVALQVVQAFIPSMKARMEGRIVNIGSVVAGGAKERSSYAASKAAINGLTHTWAIELAPYGITVNTVAPGPVDTELFRQAHPHGSDAEKEVLERIPLRRLAQPNDVAAAVVFLLGEEAGFITGQVLGIDGGITITGR